MSFTAQARAAFDYHLKTFLSQNYYGNRRAWQRWIRQNRFQRAMLKLSEQEPELAALVARGLEVFGRDPRRPSSRHSDALFLHQAVMALRPTRILECGAGLSTLIFAYSAEKLARESGRNVELVSLEESPEYLEKMVKPILPSTLAHRVRLIPSKVAYWRFENMLTGAAAAGIGFTEVPAAEFDLIYVDGPQVRQGLYQGLTSVGRAGGLPSFLGRKPFDCDAINVLLRQRRPATIIIDQRIDTRWQMKHILDKPYRAAYHFAPRKSVFSIDPAALRHVQAASLGEFRT